MTWRLNLLYLPRWDNRLLATAV